MIAKVAKNVGPAITYVCIATCLTLLIGVSYSVATGIFTRDKVMQMLAIAYGVALPQSAGEADPLIAGEDHEDASLDDVVERRALKSLDLDLRQQAVQKGVDQLQMMQAELISEKERYNNLRDSFDTAMETINKKEEDKSLLEVQRTLEILPPKQAKEQILRIIQEPAQDDKDPMEVVVKIVKAMALDKRKKILTEFKTEEEVQYLADILRRIRQDVPELPSRESTGSEP